jgi:hypothetical protein
MGMSGDFVQVLYFIGGYSVVVLTSLWMLLGQRLKQSAALARKR